MPETDTIDSYIERLRQGESFAKGVAAHDSEGEPRQLSPIEMERLGIKGPTDHSFFYGREYKLYNGLTIAFRPCGSPEP
ncbi:MAG: hypothetical protein AAB613_02680 [Patescibacteria group bacterium]